MISWRAALLLRLGTRRKGNCCTYSPAVFWAYVVQHEHGGDEQWRLRVLEGGTAVEILVQRLGVSRCRAWPVAILYVGFVYSTIPLMPKVWKVLSVHTQGAISYMGILSIVFFGGAIVWKTWRRVGSTTWKPYATLGCIGLIYIYLLKEYTVNQV